MGKISRKSLRFAIPALFALFVIPVSLILIIYSVGLSRQINEQMAQNTSSLLRMIGVELEREMAQIENYLAEISTSNTDFMDLGRETDMTRTYFMAEQIKQSFAPIIASSRNLTCILLYSDNTGVYHDVYGVIPGDTGAQRVYHKSRIREETTGAIRNEEMTPSEWFIFPVDERNYLCRMVRYQDVYCVCLVDLGHLSATFKQQFNLNGQLLFTKEGRSLIQPQYPEVLEYTWTGISNGYHIIRGTQPLQIVEDSIGIISMASLTPYQGVFQYINVIQILMVLLTITLLLALPLGYRYLRNHFTRPMDELMQVMECIGTGEMDARASEDYSDMEFITFAKTFNSMMSSIYKLQIEVYEKRLESEQAQLNALKLQIRPHFYLNCLKSTYALAAMERNKEVQENVLYLSRHLRYVFTDLGDHVTLRTELELCRNYVMLYAIGQKMPPSYRENIDPQLEEMKIPPVSLLTLVENSIKYGAEESSLRNIEVFVSARILQMEDGELINIMVRDNGPGFPKEKLDYINDLGVEHVGLGNLQKRLRYYYGDRCSVAFSNAGGAQVDLFITVPEGEELE